ncbi:MAG: hypothetical protein LBK18_04455 [Prevotellaceae bacterium]|jgi:hypothetical protein|nr:hypothetical protein [Prevotellaceae bacterium]
MISYSSSNQKIRLFACLILTASTGFLCHPLQAQEQAGRDLRTYYKLVSVAEDYIIREQYDSAAIRYREAFAYKANPFFEDLHNALLCEAKSAQPSIAAAKDYCKRLKELGYNLRYAGFTDIEVNASVLSVIMDTTVVAGSLNKAAIEVIRDMVRSDQAIREHCRQVNNGKIYSGTCWDTIKMVDSANIVRLKNLAQSVNIFDEKVVGWNIMSSDIYLLFRHSIYGDSSIMPFFEPLMLQAVHEGALNARNFAETMDMRPPQNTDSSMSDYGYGTTMLSVFRDCSNGRNFSEQGKTVALLNFDGGNAEHVRRLQEADKRRDSIYLTPAVESRIRDFRLFMCRMMRPNMNTLLFAPPFDILCGIDFGMESLKQQQKKYRYPVIYYIQGEHDFNIE